MHNRRAFPLLLLMIGTCCISLDVSAMLVFHPQPVASHQHNNRRAPKVFELTGHEQSRVTLITPDLQQSDVNVIDGSVKFRPTGKDNYHALVATRHHKGIEETAIRYIYSFGKPSGHSPSELTHMNKSELEIIPDPLPREHWHYKAGHEATFQVRFKGHPLASTSVSLFTSHASILEATTDTQGRVLFRLPDDFPDIHHGEDANPPAEMMLHVKHTNNGQNYATWLSADYRVDPRHWKNSQLGALVATGGFLFGAFVTGLGLRSSKNNIKA